MHTFIRYWLFEVLSTLYIFTILTIRARLVLTGIIVSYYVPAG